MSKFAITGHTFGIGKALYEFLYPNCIGFSRSNGYNINNPELILQHSTDCKIFINNAYEGFNQHNLLLEYYKMHYDSPKTIITVGSSTAELAILHKEIKKLEYQLHKMLLKNLIEKLQEHAKIHKHKIRVLYATFGYVGTERILNKHKHLTPDKYISEEEAVRIILQDVF